ncbi:NAD(P)H-quinone oxidoreductase, partial [Pseudomonas syringae pv. tagetis]
GSTMRRRDDTFKADHISDLGHHVSPLYTEGRLKPQLAKSYAIKDAEEAFE